MKILTLVFSIGPGGTERGAVNYARAYKNAGCDSRVWILGAGNDRKSCLEACGVKMYFDEVTGHDNNRLHIITWMPEIIHIHYFDKYIYNLILPFKQLGATIVETNVFSRPRYCKEYKIVDVSFQLAYWGFWKYHQWMSFKNNYPVNLRLPYFVNSIDFKADFPDSRNNLRQRLRLPDDAFIAGRVGQSDVAKWDRRIFQVISYIVSQKAEIFFVFVGFPEELKIELYRADKCIQERVHLIDYIHGDYALTEFYKSIDVFIHMSQIGESFGYVLVESLLCNCPVITLTTPFRDNAQFEVISHKEGGYCARSVKEVQGYLLNMYEGRGGLNLCRNELHKPVDLRFSEQVFINDLFQIFSLIRNNERHKLKELSKQSLAASRIIVNKQMELYPFKGKFLRLALLLYHLPFIYRLIAMRAKFKIFLEKISTNQFSFAKYSKAAKC